MQSFSGWFSGKSVPDNEPSQTVLAQWNTYAGKSGAPNGSQTDKLLATAEEGASTMGKLVTDAFSSVAAAATGAASTVSSSVQRSE